MPDVIQSGVVGYEYDRRELRVEIADGTLKVFYPVEVDAYEAFHKKYEAGRVFDAAWKSLPVVADLSILDGLPAIK